MAKDDKLTRDERPTTKEEKLKALDAAISHIEKQYGKGSVMKLGDNLCTHECGGGSDRIIES